MKTYVDYCLKVRKHGSMEEVAKAASALMKALHAAFSEHSARPFVLAFPHASSESPQKKLSVFRVFASSLDDQTILNEFVSIHPKYDELFYAKFPKHVPEGFAGPYKAYTRYRIASRDTPKKRLRRMLEVGDKGNLWIDMSSNENGNRFRMYVAEHDGQAASNGLTNSYGLSVSERPCFVPSI